MESTLVCTRILISILESNIDFVEIEIDNVENFIDSRLRGVVFENQQKKRMSKMGLRLYLWEKDIERELIMIEKRESSTTPEGSISPILSCRN